MFHSNLIKEKMTMFIKKLSKFSCANKRYIALSKSEKPKMFIKKLSKFRCANKRYIALSKSEKPKKGFITLSVGEERKKYQVPLKYLSDPVIQQLIKKSQPEVFDAKIDGPLEIACTTNTFDQLLKIFKDKY